MSSWRNSLPDELRVSHILEWNQENSWVLVLMAFSYRMECIFYRSLRKANLQNEDVVRHAGHRLVDAIFELNIVIERVVMHQLVQFSSTRFVASTVSPLPRLCRSSWLLIQVPLRPTSSWPTRTFGRGCWC